MDLKKFADEIAKESKIPAILGSGLMISDCKGFIPTGCEVLDLALGGGDSKLSGIKEGRFIELFGEPSAGKSTIVTCVMIQVQKLGGFAVLIDSEAKYEKQYAVGLGLDLDKLIELQPKTVEEGLLQIKVLLKKNLKQDWGDVPLVIVWDSVAASPTNAEKEKGIYGGGQAEKARLVRSGLRDITLEAANARVTVIFVNHLIATMAMYGAAKTTPVGDAIKYHSVYRLEVKKRTKMEEEGTKIEFGAEIGVKIRKGPWNQGLEVIFPLYYGKGIDNEEAWYNLVSPELQKRGVLVVGGGWLTVTMPGVEPVKMRRGQWKEKVNEIPGLKQLMIAAGCDIYKRKETYE